MILYDVELWRGGRYAVTLSGPWICQETAEAEAQYERERFWRDGADIRVIPFEAQEESAAPVPRGESA